jgi:hypothetical protein
MSGMKGVAAGAGAAALVPLAVKNAGRVARSLGLENLSDLAKDPGQALQGITSNVGDSVGSGLGDKVGEKLDEAGGPSGIIKDVLPFGGGGGGGGQKGGAPGVGKGRRMPIQQSVDIGVPIETVYNQFTQFEDWPNFMHRVKRLTQNDDCTVGFQTKIWGKNKEFTAKIDTQRPDERIKWEVTQGMTHRGVVTFHELGPNLTRVLLSFDVEPGGMIEKLARGMRYVKRAARADLHRFKAFIEYAEQETGAWRGRIEDGELVEEHDPSYDEEREYADIDDLVYSDEDEQDENEDESEDEGSDEDDDQSGEDEGSDEDDDQSPQSGRSADDDEDESDEDEDEDAGRRTSSRRGRAGESASSRQSGSRNGGESSPRTRSSQGSSRGRSGQSRRGSSEDSGSSRRQSRARSNHS